MNIMINSYGFFIIGLILLIFGSELIIENSKKIATRFRISKIIIGITLIAFGTSLPELIVSILSSYKGAGDIAISNVIGSNIANIGLVLGVISIIKIFSFKLDNQMRYNLFFLFISTIILIILSYPLGFSRLDGSIMIILFLFYLYYLLNNYSNKEENINQDGLARFNPVIILLLLTGFIFIGIGSDLFIKGTINISNHLGFANNIAISMSIVAFGTSFPELIASIVAIYKKEEEFAIGNIIGSNIINILVVASFASIVNPIFINFNLIKNHLFVLFIITLLLIVCISLFKILNKIMGMVFLTSYFVFIYITFFKTI